MNTNKNELPLSRAKIKHVAILFLGGVQKFFVQNLVFERKQIPFLPHNQELCVNFGIIIRYV